jgi:hypothetical protein
VLSLWEAPKQLFTTFYNQLVHGIQNTFTKAANIRRAAFANTIRGAALTRIV